MLEYPAPCVPEHTVPTTYSKQWDTANQRGPSAPVISGCSWPIPTHLVPSQLLGDSFVAYFSLLQQRLLIIFIFAEWKNRFGQLPDRIFWHHWIQPNPRCEVSSDESVQESPHLSPPTTLGAGRIPKVCFQSTDAAAVVVFRILEFENPHVTSNNKGTGCEFELWDCGGDPKYVSFKRVCFIKWFKNQLPAQYLGLAHFLAYIRGLVNWLVTCIALETLVIRFWYNEKSSINYQYQDIIFKVHN